MSPEPAQQFPGQHVVDGTLNEGEAPFSPDAPKRKRPTKRKRTATKKRTSTAKKASVKK